MTLVDAISGHECPNCAVKHLAAGASYLAAPCGCKDPLVLMARAAINLDEVLAGYLSHLVFAVGLLVRAEELSANYPDTRTFCRQLRLDLVTGDVSPGDAACRLRSRVDSEDMAKAHFAEAMRELPSEIARVPGTADDAAHAARSIIYRYFRIEAKESDK